MGLQDWIENFRALHLPARDRALDARELERADPPTCEAKVEFHKLPPADAERLGFLVFDTALESLKR